MKTFIVDRNNIFLKKFKCIFYLLIAKEFFVFTVTGKRDSKSMFCDMLEDTLPDMIKDINKDIPVG